MDNKGQFSIIAALLVAVILITTVMITYSTIRDSPIQDQPQVLSAIDETNFAIKQILGFTVGYYCSVLQVTGNSSYARMLAINYLDSGLINIANTHPEWAASFKLNETETELCAYWFTNTSYSTGSLALTYDLTGLGIYGITYETSCRLTVQVNSIMSSNQTQLVVMKDEGEPLINLGKQNFKFYLYRYTNLTWELTTPDTEPIAFANGTYLIDVPEEVDPYSYVVQVEDQRGLIVAASSFSRYTCTLAWNSTACAQDYVDNNTSDVDSSADKGTHSNFSGQQAGPDSLFDTITEEDILGGWGDYSSELLINPGAEFGNITGWTATGPNAANFAAGFDCPSGTAGPHTGSHVFYWKRPSSSSDWAYQEVDLSPWLSEIQSGEAQITAKGWLVCSEYHVPPWDIVRMKVVFYDDSSQEISSDTYDTGERGDLQVWTEFGIENSTIPTNAVKVTVWFQTFENNWDAGNADDFTVKVRTHNIGGNYELDLEVQWTNVNYSRTNEELCIYGGTMGSEDIQVDVWNGSAWENLFTDLSSGWNNVSVSSYLDSSTFTIRFKGSNENSDAIQDSWEIDAILLHLWPAEDLYLLLQDATIVVELLQNGTMRWLGQSLQLTTQAKPIPPIPVKAIHINQTINGINHEVPFQVEDWASDYRIPLGLTSDASVFNSRTMLVFLVNPNVSEVTIWWNGSDTAIQTPYAYTNRHFTVDTVQRTLTNGILDLEIDFSKHAGVNSFKVISTVRTSTNTAEFMRINDEVADYGNSEPTYAITNGTVRAVIHHEVEWDGGASDCPNVYAHIVLTLPANATYYTYQLRLMFVESQLDRNVTDLCPIKLTDLAGQPQTENGTAGGCPIVSNSTGLFYNFSASSWAHHWGQFVSGDKGSGIMFTDSANQMLYFFDTMAGNKTGALKVSASTDKTVELLPVTMAQVDFVTALDVAWHGAVVTFDGTTSIYKEENNTGLWITVEYPPTIKVTTEN